MTVKPKTTKGMMLMIHPHTGDATVAKDAADFIYLVRDGYNAVGVRARAVAAEIRRRDAERNAR